MTDKQIRDRIVGALSVSMMPMEVEAECVRFLDRCLDAPKWIPAKERLPEHGANVLACVTDRIDSVKLEKGLFAGAILRRGWMDSGNVAGYRGSERYPLDAPAGAAEGESLMKNEKRLIDANALNDILEEWEENAVFGTENDGTDGTTMICYPVPTTTREMQDLIAMQPTVDAVEVVHGTWCEDDFAFSTCSECGEELPESEWTPNYCPNCGAKMDLKEG